EQAARAEQLLAELEPERSYAYDYLCYRITNYRPQEASRHTLAAADAVSDLRQLVEDLSESAAVSVTEVDEPVHSVEDLSRMFNVSTKTINRWRDVGLVGRKFLFGNRRRVGFLHSTVERFTAGNRERIRRGERFSQVSEDEKGEMIQRARQLADGGASLSEVTRQLATVMSRSPETIRYTLKNFDSDNPSLAIFPNHRGALSDDDKRVIYQLFRRGSTVPQLCKRY